MKIKFLIWLIFILVLSLSLQAALSYSSPQIKVTLLSQSPDPVEPGQIVKVKFKIENEGTQTAQDAIVRIIPKLPFTIYDDKTEKNLGKLRASSTGADAAVVEFKLKVDEKAVEEETEIELVVQVGGIITSYVEDELKIDIQTHDAVLDIISIISEPEEIAPGEKAKITVMVKNLADSLLKDIRFKLNFKGNLPLAPYQSSSERRISQLESGYQKPLAFQVIAEPNAAPGLYKIPLNITYNDEKGSSYFVDDVLAVVIGEKPKITAYIKKSSVLQANKAGKITLEIANTGTTDVKFLELFVLPSDDFKLISTSNYFYLGDIDSDDTESEEIDLFINKKAEALHFPLRLKYYDANNKPYQQQFDLEMALYSSSQLRKFGLLEKSKVWLYGLLLVLFSLGYLFYRRYKKKNLRR